MRYGITVAWLTLLWVVLWRDPAPPNLVVGVVVAAVVARAVRPGDPDRTRHRVRPLAALRFLAFFAVKLVESNIVLAREVVTPTNRIETGIIGIPLPGCSDLVVTIVADAVTLTPGTLTVDVRGDDPRTVYVHVLHLHDIERARADVVRLAELVRRAFPVTTESRATEREDVA